MGTKTYVSSHKNSTYIDSAGIIHRFVATGDAGEITTDDASLQAELDAAIASGNPIYTRDENAPVVQKAVASAAQVAMEALRAAAAGRAAAALANTQT